MFDMINCIMEQQETIRIVLASDQKTAHLVPTWQDMDVLESVVPTCLLVKRRLLSLQFYLFVHS